MHGQMSITFTSDWHCGTGQGRHGGIDRLVRRDADDLPFVPAKTLLGLWRDACEKAARGLDDGADGEWSRLVERLFGAKAGHGIDPTQARGLLNVSPARLAPSWRLRLLQEDAVGAMLRKKLTTTRFGVRIDEATGVAADDTLRLIERARTGLTLETAFSLPLAGDAWPVELLLQAGARLLHHVGGSRRRGAGRCTVSIAGLTSLDELIKLHENDLDAFAIGSLSLGLPSTVEPASPAPASPPVDFTRSAEVTIDTLQPVITTKVVRGNVATGHEYIPGSSLLPLIAKAIGERSRGLIRQGHLIVSDATLVIGSARAAAIPLTMISGDKGEAWKVDGVVSNFLTSTKSVEGGKSFKGWATLAAGDWTIASLALDETAHANVDDATQRPDEDGLYTSEAIPAGTRLRCVIRASAEVTDEEWRRILALPAEQEFGRYRRSDFGAARVQVSAGEREPLREGTLTEAAVWLTSDACLLDDCGVPDPTANRLASEVADRLGVGVGVGDRSSIKVSRRESWTMNQTLPRDTRVVISAGSVVHLMFESAVAAAELDRVLRLGVGTLRTEGLGQARLVPPDEQFNARQSAKPESDERDDDEVADPPDEAWQDFVSLAWRETLAEACLAASADPQLRNLLAGANTSNATRGSLREAARQLVDNGRSIDRWINSLGTGSRRDAWGDASLDQIADVGSPGQRGSHSQEERLASVLNKSGSLPVTIPDDLAGVPPQQVAQSLLEACLSQVARLAANAEGKDGAE